MIKALGTLALLVVVMSYVILGITKIPDFNPTYISSPNAFESMVATNPLINFIYTEADWYNFLAEVRSHQSVVVIWNGLGGFVELEKEMVEELNQDIANGHTKIVVSHFVASAHAMAVCEFNEVTVLPSAILLYHMIIGPDGLVRDKAGFDECVSKGYLTKEDVEIMINLNQEVWVTYDNNGTRHVEYKPDDRYQPPVIKKHYKHKK